MIKGKWHEVERLFHQIVESNPALKSEILRTVQEEDPELYTLVVELLESDAVNHPIFAASPQQLFAKLEDEEGLIGEKVGAFQLESIIGKGAMGTVFQAKRIDGQFDQTVAIKLLRPLVMDTGMREFFHRERQILAKLNHPNIARLYDGGFTDSGRPFFTMEYVSGKTLLDYINSHHVGFNDALGLFLQVCQAVQYAHQNLIVHLDLKPQNILVNADGQVKLLDFGVSRIIEDSEEREGSFTLAYASPEQIQKKAADTRSDIYSLGVVLSELVCGEHPFQPYFRDLAGLKEAKLKGDLTFRDSGEKSPFRSDFKWICEKAMALDPASRYDSVDKFMWDVQAFLSGYPVSSHPKSWSYTTLKYVGRNRSLLASIAIAGILLVGSGVYYTIRLSEERNLAQSEAKKANQITDLLSDVFMAADPNIGGADTITAVQLLNQGFEKLETNLGDDPELYASMLSRLAPIYLNLGKYDKGRELAEKAHELNLQLEDAPAETLADNESQLAAMYYLIGKSDSSALYAEKAIKRLEYAGKVDGLSMASALLELGNVLYNYGEFERADSVYQAAYTIHRSFYDPPHVELAFELHMIGANSREKGDYKRAEEYLMKALEMKKELFEEPHLEIAYTYNHLGSLYQNLKMDSVALGYIEKSLEQRRAILGEYHVETMASMANYARTLVRLEKPLDAIPIYERALTITDSLVGKGHYYYWALTGSIGAAYFQAGDNEKAKANFQMAYKNYLELLPAEDPRIASALSSLGKVAMRENNPEEGKMYFQQALELREAAYPKGHPQIAQSQQALGECLLAIGDYSTAIEYLKMALESFNSNPDTSESTLSEVNSSLLAAQEAAGSDSD